MVKKTFLFVNFFQSKQIAQRPSPMEAFTQCRIELKGSTRKGKRHKSPKNINCQHSAQQRAKLREREREVAIAVAVTITHLPATASR